MAAKKQVSPLFAGVVIILVIVIIAAVFVLATQVKSTPPPGGKDKMTAGMEAMMKKSAEKMKAGQTGKTEEGKSEQGKGLAPSQEEAASKEKAQSEGE